VERLEQVRLAGAVRPGHQDETRLQLQVELRVRAKVAKRERAYDQPATEAPLAVPLSGRSGFARVSVGNDRSTRLITPTPPNGWA
jgi:hypothetical protein